ncbi:hypothetical protein L916_19486, partial [Phytophthora nicotianae]
NYSFTYPGALLTTFLKTMTNVLSGFYSSKNKI